MAAIRGHTRSSEERVLEGGHPRSSEVIRGHPRSSEVIRTSIHTWDQIAAIVDALEQPHTPKCARTRDGHTVTQALVELVASGP